MVKQEELIKFLIPKGYNIDDCERVYSFTTKTLSRFKKSYVKDLDDDEISLLFNILKDEELIKINMLKFTSVDCDYLRDYINLIYSTYEFILKLKKYNMENLTIDVKDDTYFTICNKKLNTDTIIINKFILENDSDNHQLIKFIYNDNKLILQFCDTYTKEEGIFLRLYPSEYIDITNMIYNRVITKLDIVNEVLIDNKCNDISFKKEISENDIAILIINK